MTTEGFYQKHRPKTLKGVVGQDRAVNVLRTLLDKGLPHALLFVGGSGTGKTTLARILKKQLNCGDHDFFELNIADLRGIDNVREIRSRMSLAPVSGDCRIWLLDEFHNSTKESMEAMLKLLEDTPKHVYFFLCTTHPQKLLPTILTRCTKIQLEPVSQEALTQLVLKVAAKEEGELSEEVAEKIAECAQGSAREALVLLESVLWLEDDTARLETLQKSGTKRVAENLAAKLCDLRTTWGDIMPILRDDVEDGESTRRGVLNYAMAILIDKHKKGANPQKMQRALNVIQAFRYDFYSSGKAGLCAACWEVVQGGS